MSKLHIVGQSNSGEVSLSELLDQRSMHLAQQLITKYETAEKAAAFLVGASFGKKVTRLLPHERADYAGAALKLAQKVPAQQAALLEARAAEWAQPENSQQR